MRPLTIGLALILLVGCGSSRQLAATEKQAPDVESYFRDGQEILISTKPNSSVALFMESGDEHFRLTLAIKNYSSEPVLVDPAAVDVLSAEDGWYVFLATYAPGEAADKLTSDERRTAFLNALASIASGANGQWARTRAQQVNAHAYDQQADQTEAYVEASVLRKNTVWPGGTVVGSIYGEFKTADRYKITVPVGTEEHVFTYSFR